jgi:hypothetical protein
MAADDKKEASQGLAGKIRQPILVMKNPAHAA